MHPSPAPLKPSSYSTAHAEPALDPYVRVRLLGEGALACVTLVRDQRDGALYALKSVALSDEDERGVLKREFRMRSILGHPQVAAPRELVRDVQGGQAHLVLDYVDGASLIPALQVLGSSAIPRLLAQALGVVGWLHQRGIVHCDLKPENLCVEGLESADRALLCLLDFGTAIDLIAGESQWIGGTPAYLAPYLKRSGRPQPKSDLFALGRAFQEALASLDEGAPRELAYGPVLVRLTQDDPDLAYGSAEDALLDLISRVPQLQALELPLPSEPPFIGRVASLDALLSHCAALKAGLLTESLCLVEGAAGVGKSRVLGELARRARLRDLQVFFLRCPEQASPLEPIIDLVARLLPKGHPEHVNLARVLAGTDQRVAGEGTARLESSGISQEYLRRLARTISSDRVGNSVLVLIDDLEAADSDTISFLRILSRLADADGPLVVAALNSRRGMDCPARELLLPGERVHVCHLKRLNSKQITKLLKAFLPSRLQLDVELSQWVPLCEGLPSTAVEIVHSLTYLRGAVQAPEGSADETGSQILARLVACRLRTLEPEQRLLLESLALLEQACPLALLADLLHEDRAALQIQLKHLMSFGLVDVDLRRAGRRYHLNSTLIGNELRRMIAPDRQTAFHRAALEAWSRWPLPFERPTEMLAVHAMRGGLWERAFELAWSAVKELGTRGGLGGIVTMARRFQPHLQGARAEIRGDLLCALADCLQRQGHSSEACEALAELGDPMSPSSFQGTDPQRIPVLLMQATLRMEDGDSKGALPLLEGALGLANETACGVHLGRLYERLGCCHLRLGERSAARHMLELGVRILEPEPAGVVLASTLNNLGLIDSQEGRLAAASAHHLRALEIRRALGDLDGQSRSLSNLSIVEFYREDYVHSKEHAAEALRIKRLIGMPSTQALTLINLALSCRVRGELGAALAHIEEAMALMERVGERFATAISRRALALILHLKGECRRAREELAISRSLMEAAHIGAGSMVYQILMESSLALDEQRLEGALELAQEGIRTLSDVGTPAALSGLHKCLGRAELGLGNPRAALGALERSRELAEQAGDRLEMQWITLWQARTRLALGEPDRAGEMLAEVESHARQAGTPQLLAEVLLSMYDLHAGDGGEQQIRGSLIEAEHLASRLGLPQLQMHAWHRLGLQAASEGLVSRAQQWWLRGAQALERWLGELEPEQRECFLQRAQYPEFLDCLGVDRASAVLLETKLKMPNVGGALRPEILRRLLSISSVLNAKRTREGVLIYLRQQLNELFGAENSQVVLVGRDGALCSLGGNMDDGEAPFSRTLIERVLLERKSILIRDATDDPELQGKKSIHRLGLMSVLCAPLVVDDEPIGVIQFNHRSNPGPFSQEDLTVLDLFALQAATALKNMLLIERLDETIDQLTYSKAELNAGEQLRALGQITAGVTHDFNNLLTILNGTIELIRMAPNLPESVHEDLATLETVSQTTSSTVSRLQMFRGQSGADLISNEFDLDRVVRQAAELGARRFVDSKQHHISTQEQLPGRASGSQSELREVLLNLIVNAVEAMPQGGKVLLSTSESERWVSIEVEDEGLGLDPELLPRIFEPFFSTKKTGHGLGLSISATIIGSMGGLLEAEPRRPCGTRFRISLPRAGASAN